MKRLWQDLSYATRNLLARPAFALASILSLALGIGACSAIFTIVDAVLLRPLPYPDAVRVVQLKEVSAKGTRMPFGEPNFVDVRARNHSLEAIAEYSGGSASTMLTTVIVVGRSEPVRAPVYAVSGDFFRVLGVAPIVGRTFLPEEVKSGAPVAVVSYGFWRRLLSGKTDLAGTTLRIDNQSFAVVGVLARIWVFQKPRMSGCRARCFRPKFPARRTTGASSPGCVLVYHWRRLART